MSVRMLLLLLLLSLPCHECLHQPSAPAALHVPAAEPRRVAVRHVVRGLKNTRVQVCHRQAAEGV